MKLADRPISIREWWAGAIAVNLALVLLVVSGALYLYLLVIPPINAYVQHLALNFLCAPAIMVLLFCISRYDSWLARLLSAPRLVALGEISYSIYLIHTWTLRVFLHPAPPLTSYWLMDASMRVTAGIGLTLVTSYATYRLIELPGRVALRRLLGRTIAYAFGDRRPVAKPSFPSHQPARRSAFVLLAVAGLVVVAVSGEAARSEPFMTKLHSALRGFRSEIAVSSASYGLSCKDYHVPPPFQNTFAPGNATEIMKLACNGTTSCDFLITTDQLGDPANSCGKDFSAQYRCTGDQTLRNAYVPGEAQGKHVVLQCSPAQSK